MATFILTNPTANLTIFDPTPSDTITVTDGPPENGFQTSQVATAGTTTIFANATAVTIDGQNKGDAVVLDNPDPAAAMQSLSVTNLGTGSTINGGNPNANSPDIAVVSLTLVADKGVGVSRALRTQVSTLAALAGSAGAGNINIANGVAAPVTLNIAALIATNGAGGTITLSNNGTINDTNSGIAATGAIGIAANGATADFDTGSGAVITSNTGSVGLTAGRDIILGDTGNGSVNAAAGITASAGGNFTMDASAIVTNSTSGNIAIAAAGNFTMLTSPGSFANAPEIVNNAAGGAISLSAGSGHTLTLDSTGATAVQSNNGAITLTADAMVINKAINSGTARTILTPATAGQAISLGGHNAPGVLGVTFAEVDQIPAGVLQIGSATAGNITIDSGGHTASGVLSLINNGSISEPGVLFQGSFQIRISSTGAVTLNNPNNKFDVLAASAAGGLTVINSRIMTVDTVDGVTGITTTNSPVNLTADAMAFNSQINAGTGIVTLAPRIGTVNVELGSGNSSGTLGFLGLDDNELGLVTASVLRVDGDSSIIVSGPVNRHAGYNTLSLGDPFGSINQTAALSVAKLALTGNFTLTNTGNAVDTLAFNAFGDVDFTNSGALTIGAVDGIASSSNTGTTTLTSTNGAILDGANGAVDVTAPTLVLSAATGIGTAAAPFQTQIGTLNATTSTGGVFINNGKVVPAILNIGNGGGGVHVTGASGDISLVNNGAINSLSNNDNIQGPGTITLKALGAGADLTIGGQSLAVSVLATGSGLIDLKAGRDIALGGSVANSLGVVQSLAGSIFLQAGRNFTINPNAVLKAGGGAGSITASAGGNFTMLTSPATIANAPDISAAGNITLSAGAGHTMTLASTGTNAVISGGGNITLSADAMTISQGVNAGAGNVLIQPVSAGGLIGLGTAALGLQLSNAALNQVTAKTLTIGNAAAGWIVLGGAVAPAHVTNLTINTGGNFSALGGSTLNIGAGVLTIGFDESNLGATADLSGATITAGTTVVIAGAGNDTIITGAGPETINGGGGTDTAVFSGTLAQYTVMTAGGVTTVTKGGVTDTLTGIKFLHFSDQTISPTPPPMTPAGTTADMILRDVAHGGQLEVYDLGGNMITAAYAMGAVGLDWQVAGFGQFNGNASEADLILRSASTGAFEFYDIQQSQIVAAGSLGSVGTEWHSLGLGTPLVLGAGLM